VSPLAEDLNLTEESFLYALKAMDWTSVDSNILQKLESITSCRTIFSIDPNGILNLLLHKETDDVKIFKLVDTSDITQILDCLKEDTSFIILVEDIYYENVAVSNCLLDDYLADICDLALQNGKFVFFLCKTVNMSLPHSAYSRLFFLNLQLSSSEVLNLMVNLFNLSSNKDVATVLKDLEKRIKDLYQKVDDLQDRFLSYLRSKEDVDEELISFLYILSSCRLTLSVSIYFLASRR